MDYKSSIYRCLCVILPLLLATGCGGMHMDFNFAKPSSLKMKPPPGPPEYQKGWVEGCNSGWKAYTNTFNKVFGKFEQDPILAQNDVYYQVWKDAYAYCAQYANSVGELGVQSVDGRGGTVFDVIGVGSWDGGSGGLSSVIGPVGATTMPEWRNPWINEVSQPEYNNPF